MRSCYGDTSDEDDASLPGGGSLSSQRSSRCVGCGRGGGSRGCGGGRAGHGNRGRGG